MVARASLPFWLWFAATPAALPFEIDERLLAGRWDQFEPEELAPQLDLVACSQLIRGIALAPVALLIYALFDLRWDGPTPFGVSIAILVWPAMMCSLTSASRVLLRVGWEPAGTGLRTALRLSPVAAAVLASAIGLLAALGL